MCLDKGKKKPIGGKGTIKPTNTSRQNNIIKRNKIKKMNIQFHMILCIEIASVILQPAAGKFCVVLSVEQWKTALVIRNLLVLREDSVFQVKI